VCCNLSVSACQHLEHLPVCLNLLCLISTFTATTDDGDFFQELRDMLGVEQQEGAGPGRWAAGGTGSRRRKLSEVS
jgi:hypothetical protein